MPHRDKRKKGFEEAAGEKYAEKIAEAQIMKNEEGIDLKEELKQILISNIGTAVGFGVMVGVLFIAKYIAIDLHDSADLNMYLTSSIYATSIGTVFLTLREFSKNKED